MNFNRMAKLSLGVCLMAAASTFAAPDPNFHIYLAFGQSNMEGQGNIEQQDKSVDKRFQMMATVDRCNGRALGTWNDAVPPLASCDGKLGPADYFGRTMVEKTDKSIKVGVIVVAVAGCDIGLFSKDNYRNYTGGQSWYTNRVNAYGGNPYGRLIEMAKKAQQDGVIKGIIFHQGETNSGDGNWPSNVKKVYDNIIKDLDLGDDIPFLAGEVLRSGSSAGANSNIAKLPQQSKNFYVISSEGFNQALGDGQNVHFTSQEYRDFGKRYAEKMIEVLGDKIKPAAAETPSSSSAAPASSSSIAASSSSKTPASSSVAAPASSSVAAPASSSVVTPASSSVDAPASSSVNAPASSDGLNSSGSGTNAIAATTAKGVSIGTALVSENAILVPVTLARASSAKVRVHTALGQQVLSLNRELFTGENTISLDRAQLPAGNYLVSVQVGSECSMVRFVIAQ